MEWSKRNNAERIILNLGGSGYRRGIQVGHRLYAVTWVTDSGHITGPLKIASLPSFRDFSITASHTTSMRRRSFTDQPLLDEQGNPSPAAAVAAERRWWDFETIAPTPRDKLSLSLIFVSCLPSKPEGPLRSFLQLVTHSVLDLCLALVRSLVDMRESDGAKYWM